MAKLQNVLAHNASRLRMVMGKTQKQIAVMAGVSQKTISTLETQDSPISPRLARLALEKLHCIQDLAGSLRPS